MHETHNASVSKHLRGEKNAGWICPPTWKLNFTCPLMRINYTSPPQSCQAALRFPESVLTAKIIKKSKLSKHFPLLEQISRKSLKSNEITFCYQNLKFLNYSKP